MSDGYSPAPIHLPQEQGCRCSPGRILKGGAASPHLTPSLQSIPGAGEEKDLDNQLKVMQYIGLYVSTK